jgi:RimJ/RimL family protein N-acetyltransferase
VERLPERVERGGLLLRRWNPWDAAVLHAAVSANVDHLRPRMAWIAREPLSLEDRVALLREWEGDWRAGGDAIYGIFAAGRPDGPGLGSCGLHRRIGPDGLEIGYWVDRHHLRQGIATRAVAALTDLAFTVPGIDRVEIPHDIENVASRGVPAGLGYTVVGERSADRDLAPADTGTDLVWRLDRHDWLLRQS